MKRLLLVTVAGSAIVTGSVLAARPEGDEGPGGRGGRRGDLSQMRSELGLSDDQVAQLQKMRSDGRAQRIRHQADLRIARGELQDLLRAPAVDEKAVAAKVKQLTDLQAAGTRARVDHQLALRRILTPEQMEKMHSLMQQRFADGPRRRPFRGRGHGGEPGPDAPGPGPGSDQ